MSDEKTNPEEIETTDVEKVPFNLNMHVARLLMNEPFFAALSRRIDKREYKGIPTAGVRLNPDTAQFELLYNPDFFDMIPDKQRLGVLKHEFYHVIFEHLTGRKPEDTKDKNAAMLWNYATDLAINSHLHGELPKECLFPGEGQFAHLPSGKSSEWYLKELKKNPPQQQEGDGEGEGQGGSGGYGEQFDSHEGWDEADSTTREMAKERLKEAMKKAAEEATKNSSWGSIPSQIRKDITSRLQGNIDWRKVLRYFVKTSQRSSHSSTMKRINRRYPYIHPGRKINRQASIAVSIDQSGSVNDMMLQAFFAELNKLADIATFTVIPFDSEVAVDKVYVWKKGEKKKWERVRYGGTDFDAPTKYVNDNNFDGHIVLTDLCAPKPKASKCQRMWMTSRYYAERPYFTTKERVIVIDTP